MTWPESRAKIKEYIADLGYVTHLVAPAVVDAGAQVVVFLIPPASEPERHEGGNVDTTYSQRLMVLHEIGDGGDEAAALAVDDARVAITNAFHAHVTLEGAATSTTPVAWEEAYRDKYPPGGSVDFVMMVGSLDVTINEQLPVGA